MTQRRLSSTLKFVNYLDALRRTLLTVMLVSVLLTFVFSSIVFLAQFGYVPPAFIVVLVVAGLLLLGVLWRFGVAFIGNVVVAAMTILLYIQLDTVLPLALGSVILLFIAPFLTSRWVYIAVLAVVAARMTVLELAQPVDVLIFRAFPYLVPAFIFSVILRIFRERFDAFAESTRQASDQVQRALQLSRTLAGYTDETTLSQYTVRGLKTQFDLLDAAVYLTTQEANAAVLVAGTDQASVGSSLPINTRSIVGRALLSAETIILRFDAGRPSESPPRVPSARAQAVLPLLDRDRVIGALELYSANPDAFSVDFLNALQIVANSLSQALRQARALQEQQALQQQLRRVAQENEANLLEVERLSRQITRQAWSEYVQIGAAVTGVTLQPNSFSPGAEWSPVMVQAVQQRRAAVEPASDGGYIAAVPLELRNEVIGALQVKLDAGTRLSEAVDVLRAVAERLAVSLESARLFEEAQAATIQEQRVNELIAQMQTSDSLEAMLQQTLQGLSQALETSNMSIRLGTFTTQSVNGGAE
jgi:GAF domain-containing protein